MEGCDQICGLMITGTQVWAGNCFRVPCLNDWNNLGKCSPIAILSLVGELEECMLAANAGGGLTGRSGTLRAILRLACTAKKDLAAPTFEYSSVLN